MGLHRGHMGLQRGHMGPSSDAGLTLKVGTCPLGVVMFDLFEQPELCHFVQGVGVPVTYIVPPGWTGPSHPIMGSSCESSTRAQGQHHHKGHGQPKQAGYVLHVGGLGCVSQGEEDEGADCRAEHAQ